MYIPSPHLIVVGQHTARAVIIPSQIDHLALVGTAQNTKIPSWRDSCSVFKSLGDIFLTASFMKPGPEALLSSTSCLKPRLSCHPYLTGTVRWSILTLSSHISEMWREIMADLSSSWAAFLRTLFQWFQGRFRSSPGSCRFPIVAVVHEDHDISIISTRYEVRIIHNVDCTNLVQDALFSILTVILMKTNMQLTLWLWSRVAYSHNAS